MRRVFCRKYGWLFIYGKARSSNGFQAPQASRTLKIFKEQYHLSIFYTENNIYQNKKNYYNNQVKENSSYTA